MSTIIESTKLKDLFESSDSPEQYVAAFQRRMCQIIESLDRNAIATLIDYLEETCQKGRRIFLMGNGGSAAVTSHMVVDLAVNSLVEGQPPYRVISLCDNTESLTAIANDHGYDEVFVRQLNCHLEKGDLVIAFSVSGASKNILKALELAKELAVKTVGLCGFDGGELKEFCDLLIHIPTATDEYGPVEDVFSCIGHMVTGYITMKRGRSLGH